MTLFNDKRGFIDMEVLSSPGFWALLILAEAATLLGWVGSKKMGIEAVFPFWQILLFMFFEVIIVYVVALKMFD